MNILLFKVPFFKYINFYMISLFLFIVISFVVLCADAKFFINANINQ